MLVGLGHAARKRAVDEPGNAALAPEPRIGAPEADDRGGLRAAQRPGIGAQDAHGGMVRMQMLRAEKLISSIVASG